MNYLPCFYCWVSSRKLAVAYCGGTYTTRWSTLDVMKCGPLLGGDWMSLTLSSWRLRMLLGHLDWHSWTSQDHIFFDVALLVSIDLYLKLSMKWLEWEFAPSLKQCFLLRVLGGKCPLQTGEELFPQVVEFRYLRFCLWGKKVQSGIDKWFGTGSAVFCTSLLW